MSFIGNELELSSESGNIFLFEKYNLSYSENIYPRFHLSFLLKFCILLFHNVQKMYEKNYMKWLKHLFHISGVFVRIKDKNLHVDCFKCATCGSSLKNQGYFNLNNKLYCDVHARLAAMNSPPPTAIANGLAPVTFPPS